MAFFRRKIVLSKRNSGPPPDMRPLIVTWVSSHSDGCRYVVHSKDLRVEGNIVYIPIYMAMFL